MIFSLFATSETQAQWRYSVGNESYCDVGYYVEAYSSCSLMPATPWIYSGTLGHGDWDQLTIPAGWIVRYVQLISVTSVDTWDCTMGFYHMTYPDLCGSNPSHNPTYDAQIDGNAAKATDY